jgi:transposase-like protein
LYPNSQIQQWLTRPQHTSATLMVKPYNVQELCRLYGVSDKTLRTWLAPFRDEIGERRGRYYTVLQVEFIFNKLGIPYCIEEEK